MRTTIAVVLLAACAMFWQETTKAAAVTTGHSAMWYSPDRDGEGWVLEVLANDQAALYWYTYDESGNQRWLTANGDILRLDDAPDAIVFDELTVTSGGEFGDDFDPNDVSREIVGTATIHFNSCHAGTFSYEAFGQSQDIAITRLTNTMAAVCDNPRGTPGARVRQFAGQSGSWYDPARDGQGFAMQWLAQNQAMLTWYTYDSDGNQRWVVGLGQYVDGQLKFSNLETTKGARFGAGFDRDDVVREEWGEVVFDIDCDAGTASWSSEFAEFGTGSLELVRLTKLADISCPYQEREFGDIYSAELMELPTKVEIEGNEQAVYPLAIANDDKVLGRFVFDSQSYIAFIEPPYEAWELHAQDFRLASLFMSDDGTRLATSDQVTSAIDDPLEVRIADIDGAWSPIQNSLYYSNALDSASNSLSALAGRGRQKGDPKEAPWVWTDASGQVELPLSAEIRIVFPHDLNEDGSVIAGQTLLVDEDSSELPRVAVQWIDQGAPNYLYDDQGRHLGSALVCGEACDVVFGVAAEESQEFPVSIYPGVWIARGGIYQLSISPPHDHYGDAARPSNYPGASSHDGTLMGGNYVRQLPDGSVMQSAFLWTQLTGAVSVQSYFESQGLGDTNWSSMQTVDISSEGGSVLITGEFGSQAPDANAPASPRAVVLKLRKR